ncbi:MAG: Crp/Fnr family transcriptional regulator [Deferrisomatales bacterium]
MDEATSVGEIRSKRRPAGEILLREGAPAASLFLLLEGCVCLYRRSPSGRLAVAGFCRPGDVVGEALLLGLHTSQVTAVCLEPCVTQELSAAALEDLVAERPSLGWALLCRLAGQMHRMAERIAALSEPALAERTHAVLTNAARTVGRPHPEGWALGTTFSHEEIGRLAGAHRVSVTRALARLRSAGRIRTERRNIVVVQGETTCPGTRR